MHWLVACNVILFQQPFPEGPQVTITESNCPYHTADAIFLFTHPQSINSKLTGLLTSLSTYCPYFNFLDQTFLSPRSLALQADSLPSEPPGKPLLYPRPSISKPPLVLWALSISQWILAINLFINIESTSCISVSIKYDQWGSQNSTQDPSSALPLSSRLIPMLGPGEAVACITYSLAAPAWGSSTHLGQLLLIHVHKLPGLYFAAAPAAAGGWGSSAGKPHHGISHPYPHRLVYYSAIVKRGH